MNDSEDDSRFDPHDLSNDDKDDERKPASKKYNTGLGGGYNTGGAVNSEDDEKDEDYKGSPDESVDDNDDYTNTNDESGVDIDDAFFSSTAFADTVEMIGGGEDEHEYISAQLSKKHS